MSAILTKLGITPDSVGLLKAQQLYLQVAARLNEAIDAVKGKTSEALDKLREAITDDDTKRAENVRDAFYREAEALTGEDRARFFLATLDVLEGLSTYAEASAAEFVSEAFQANASEALSTVAEDYETAVALREAANSMLAMHSQFGMPLPDGIKLKQRKVKGGNEATVLDWPNVSDPSKIDVAKGKRSYTTNLPVFTIDGNELPHGTNVRKVAVDHVSTEANPLNASALLDIFQKECGKEFKATGGTVTINGRTVAFTEWKPVGQEEEATEEASE